MITLGVLLLILGFVFAIHIFWILGIILVVAGVALYLLGLTGHAVGRRRHYW
ncbi:DUF6131 family protein [Streptomyces sp. NPDC096198]|uniref:DUF6131 family protein n=1 Tax=Streptomyces sp. NPDC096198 TaxID=3366080 RepID=UPI0037F61BB1